VDKAKSSQGPTPVSAEKLFSFTKGRNGTTQRVTKNIWDDSKKKRRGNRSWEKKNGQSLKKKRFDLQGTVEEDN